jgi:flagellar basal body-associated protein FliL
MSKVNNEKGAALVLVLWIIVLFVVLGTILFAQLLTTSKQMVKQEEAAAETDIINMSVVYVSTYLKQQGGEDGITEKELTSLLRNVPNSIIIDEYTATLSKPELEGSQIKLTITVSDEKGNERTEVEYIPISK